MAVLTKNKVINTISIDPVVLLQTDSQTKITIIGLSFTNLTNLFAYVDVLITDDASSTGYYLKDTLLPSGSSLRAVSNGEKLILGPNNILSARSSVVDSVDVIISYVEV